MANDTKSVADVTDVPEGLDVIPTVPGTFVGGHDVQGADGKPRDDRPGEILGTPANDTTRHDQTAREQTAAQTDFVTQEVDRNNREVLPLLGGPNTDALGWKPEEGGVPEVIANARTISPEEGRASSGVTTRSVAGTSAARPSTSTAKPAEK